MGIDAVSRQAKANVAVFGLNALAIEVVKNIVLSGCRKITLIDDSNVTWRDLADSSSSRSRMLARIGWPAACTKYKNSTITSRSTVWVMT
jgi:tRNA A37 threonylcarbamoyladenosine dehydratase